MASVTANVVDIAQRRVWPATVTVRDGRIAAIEPTDQPCSTFLMPGFIDAHVHVESSMLCPSAFARAAVVHGTVGTVSDPHEIANVLGEAGVRFMLDDAATVPFKFRFGAPSCVPATPFETAGDALDVDAVARLLDDPRIGYLAEMMNYPGVLAGDEEVLAKIAAAKQRGKPVDGHAPGLRDDDARRYIQAGISTDHECFTLDEARDKLAAGAVVQIREGSAARNYDALHPLLENHADRLMFCSDDKHPDELIEGHINRLAARAVADGHDVFNVLTAACVNPVKHYGLNIGLLRVGEPADFIEVDSIEHFNVLRTWIDGQLVAEQGDSLIATKPAEPINRFHATSKDVGDFAVQPTGASMNVIEAMDGQLVTQRLRAPARDASSTEADVLKIAVVNRYADTPPAVGFVKGFGLKRGAIAGSVAHDSHNVIGVGVDDASLCEAINAVIEMTGGLAAVVDGQARTLALPIAGLMSDQPIETVAAAYQQLDGMARHLGTTLRAPYMTLSFMALLVIPEIKLSDKGLFDGKAFAFFPLYQHPEE